MGLLTLPIVLWLPGAVLLRAVFGPRGPLRTDGLGWLFLSLAVSVLLTGLIGFMLAEAGWFSVWLIALLEVLGCLGALGVAAGDRAALRPAARAWLGELGWHLAAPFGAGAWRAWRTDRAARVARIETFVLIALMLLGAALFARPAEMIRGALDSGVYVNAGVALARSGAIVQRDPLMRDLRDDDPTTFAPVSEARQFLQPLNLERYTLNRLRMPGFYMLEKKSGEVLAQFYSLYPVWIAIFYQLFGLYGALFATPLLALFACVAVFFFGRRLFSMRVALVALAFLITCPLQIWFARYPVSEIPTELLAFLFFYGFLRFHEETGHLRALEATGARDAGPAGSVQTELAAVTLSARFFGALAAVALGEIALTRVDFIFYLLPVVFYLLWWRLSRTWRPAHTWFAVTLAVLLGIWLIYFLFFAFAYTMDEYHNVILDQRRAWPRWLPALYLGTIALVVADRWQPRLRPPAARIGGVLARRRRLLVGALCALAGAYVVYRYLWEPHILLAPSVSDALLHGQIPFAWQSYIGAPLESVAQTGKGGQTGLINSNSYILVRLGWYLSPLGIALGTAGLLRALWQRLTAGSGYFFVVLIIIGGLFTTETFTNPIYPYSLRHFLPVVIPGLLLLAAYALTMLNAPFAMLNSSPKGAKPAFPIQNLKLKIQNSLAWAMAVALVLFFVVTGAVIITHTEDAGAVAQISALARRFPDPAHTVLLFSNERDEPYVVATPLQYIFGFTCFSLNLPYGSADGKAVQGAVQRWMAKGYHVYAILGANGGKLIMPDLTLVPDTVGGAAQWTYNVSELEQLKSQKPKNIAPSTLPWGLYSVQTRAATGVPPLPFTLDVGGLDYAYLAAGFAVQEKTHPADTNAWRWTGPDAFLRLPWPDTARGALTLTLRLSAGPAERAVPLPSHPTVAQTVASLPGPAGLRLLPAPAQVTIAAGALRLGQVTLPLPPRGGDPIFQDVAFAVPANAPRDPADAHTLLIHLTSSTWAPADAGVSADARALGVIVDQVTLRAGGP